MKTLLNTALAGWLGMILLVPGGLSAAPATDGSPDPQRWAEVTQLLPLKPRGAGPTIADRRAWEAVAKAPGFQDVVRRAERLLKEPIPELPDDLYLDYSRTGNRDRYQRVLSQRHARMPALVLAECLENQGRFLPAIEASLRAILAEKTWVLPAHDGGLANFRGRVVEIDLTAAATGSSVATAAWWLGDRLSPETRKLIHDELRRRIFTSFSSMVREGKPRMWWLTTTNNWNAVCLAGVTGAATAALDCTQSRAFFVASAEKYVQNFLDGFTADGYCSEGMGYWNYGFGNFMVLAENLYQSTGGKLDLWKNPKVAQIARFGRRLEILPGVYPAFADCHLDSRPDVRIMGFVSRRYGFGWQDFEQRGLLLAPGPTSDLLEFGLLGFANSATRHEAKPAPAGGDRSLRDWFDEAGILICRPDGESSRAMGVALKGGHNAEHHNHNDVGSFVVALDGKTPLLDPGAEVYTARTFSGRRYDSKVLNSFGHPVPRVAGQLQQTGRQAAARVVKTEFTDKADTLVLDIRSAYAVKELKKLQRTFVFSRAGRGTLTVLDEVEFSTPQSFETALITLLPWKQAGPGRLVVGRGAEAVRVEISAEASAVEVKAEEIHEDLPGRRIPTRLGIGLVDPVSKGVLRVTIAPANK